MTHAYIRFILMLKDTLLVRIMRGLLEIVLTAPLTRSVTTNYSLNYIIYLH